MENIDWPLLIRASWLGRRINTSSKLTNPLSISSKIVGPAIQEAGWANMIGKETSITMRRLKNLATNSQAMIRCSMVTIPPSVWAIPTMEPAGTEAV